MKEAVCQILMGLFALAGGLVTAGGVFALITVIGIIPRLAGRSRTGAHIHAYETAICLGGILGNLADLYEIPLDFGGAGEILFGLCSGIFVGCLVMSLAETVDVIPILVRRTRLRVGVQFVVLSFALGKGIGSILYFTEKLTG